MEANIPIFKQPNFLKLWFSQSFHSLAQILIQVIVMVEVYQRTESATGPALVLALMSLTLFVSSFLASYSIDSSAENFTCNRLVERIYCYWYRIFSIYGDHIGAHFYVSWSYGFIIFECVVFTS